MKKGNIVFAIIFLISSISFCRELKVLGFNVWALPLSSISKDLDARFALIPQAVADSNADVVVFEEAWQDFRKIYLINELRNYGYLYSNYGDPEPELGTLLGRGVMGNGLLIVSKFPLTEPTIMKFSNYTRPDEYPAFKGAIYTQVDIPDYGVVDLFATHLGAFTTENVQVNGQDVPDHMNADQLLIQNQQARELVVFIQENRKNKNMILVGDLNSHYYKFLGGVYHSDQASKIYSLMTCLDNFSNRGCLNLNDTFVAMNGLFGRTYTSSSRPYSYDTETNDYARGGLFSTEPPGVIDYIFVNRESNLYPIESKLIFTERLPFPAFLSDHYGVETTFEFKNY